MRARVFHVEHQPNQPGSMDMINETHEPRDTGARVLGEEREKRGERRERRERGERRESVFTPLYAAGLWMCDEKMGKAGSSPDKAP